MGAGTQATHVKSKSVMVSFLRGMARCFPISIVKMMRKREVADRAAENEYTWPGTPMDRPTFANPDVNSNRRNLTHAAMHTQTCTRRHAHAHAHTGTHKQEHRRTIDRRWVQLRRRDLPHHKRERGKRAGEADFS
jgi:hypothetical protein